MESSSNFGDNQETKSKIFDYILGNPGTHVRKISRELGIAMGDLQYHLYALEKQGKIQTLRRGLYKFIFATGLFGEQQSVILSLLSQETPRELLLYLIQRPDSSQSNLAHFTRLSPPTISWHMKRLVELGVVVREQRGKTATYRVIEPVQELGRFIQNYHPSIWQKWASRLADLFLAFDSNEASTEGG
ncbi:MAG: winged helix-turn-helix transcriptional regulator [Nitrososphaerota archaeon]|nr:winged helix-turn-helix transcriptional regulator [Nitrososphaerota archaeon]